MGKTLQQILDYQTLMGIIQDPTSGVPDKILPPAFTTPNRKIAENNCTYTKVEGTRKTARLVQYGAPSERRNQAGISEVPVVLLHSAEHIEHKMPILTALRQFDNPQAQERGQQVIDLQTASFRALFQNLRISAIMQALFQGANWFDGSGNLLGSSSGAVVSVDYGIPSGNQAQLDVFGSGDLIGASWATAGTDIIGQLEDLKQAAVRLTGYPIMHAFYGKNILGYLVGNTDVQTILRGDSAMSAAFLRREVPDGFLGLDWHPAYESFFVDDDGSYQSLIPDDGVVFTPDPSPDWWEVIEGSYEIPTSIGNVAGDGKEMLGDLQTVYGMFSYAKLNDDPPSIKHVAGDTFLPVPKVPGAIFQADVTP